MPSDLCFKKNIQFKYLKYFKHTANDLKFKDILVWVSGRTLNLQPEIIWLFADLK